MESISKESDSKRSSTSQNSTKRCARMRRMRRCTAAHPPRRSCVVRRRCCARRLREVCEQRTVLQERPPGPQADKLIGGRPPLCAPRGRCRNPRSSWTKFCGCHPTSPPQQKATRTQQFPAILSRGDLAPRDLGFLDTLVHNVVNIRPLEPEPTRRTRPI